MPVKAPKTAPFFSVGAIMIHGSENARYNASVFLIKTGAYPDRRDIVLGAGHNLRHLADSDAEVLVATYCNRDINSIAQREDDSFRYAIANDAMPNDFGVAILAEPPPEGIVALELVTPEDATTIAVGVAGANAAEVLNGDYGIWLSETDIRTHGGVSYSAPGVTVQGMSGGPVFPQNTADRAIALVHGTGAIDRGEGPVPADLYVTMTEANITRINELIAIALAG